MKKLFVILVTCFAINTIALVVIAYNINLVVSKSRYGDYGDIRVSTDVDVDYIKAYITNEDPINMRVVR